MKPNPADLLERLRESDEVRSIEAKSCQDGLGKDVIETVSAFSNEPGLGGGFLVFGVREIAPRQFEVVGLSDPKKIEHDLASRCATDLNRAVRPLIETATLEGKSVVAAFIPEAAPSEKPIFIASRGMERGAYRRVGSGDQRCTEDDLRVLFASGTSLPFEDSMVRDATAEDVSLDVVAAYRRQLLDENPGSELRDASGMELVQAVGGARQEHGAWVPTVAGVLLFGTRPALRRLFPQLRVDYVRVPGVRWVPDADRRYDTIEIRDPLLTGFRRAYQAVLDDMPRSFVLEDGAPERQNRPALPEKVVREALVNAFTHRDFRAPRPTLIIRYADRLEIHNPGHALVSEEQFGQPGSFPRNPRIADYFREMRLAENKGTGIEAMRRAMRQAQLSPPLFASDERNGRFVTTLWLHSLLDEDERSWIDSLQVDLTPAQRQALVIALRTGEVTNAALRDVTGLDPIQSRRELHLLRDAELLRQHGDRGQARYVVGTRAAALWSGDPAKLPLGSPGFEGGAAGDAPRRGREASDLGSSVTAAAGDSTSFTRRASDLGGELLAGASDPGDRPSPSAVDTGGGVVHGDPAYAATDTERQTGVTGELPRDLQVALDQLGVRAQREQLESLLVRLCQLRPWAPVDLGRLLRRDPRVLVRDYLGGMVQRGLLRLERPDQPTDPRQRYVATQTILDPGSREMT